MSIFDKRNRKDSARTMSVSGNEVEILVRIATGREVDTKRIRTIFSTVESKDGVTRRRKRIGGGEIMEERELMWTYRFNVRNYQSRNGENDYLIGRGRRCFGIAQMTRIFLR